MDVRNHAGQCFIHPDSWKRRTALDFSAQAISGERGIASAGVLNQEFHNRLMASHKL